MIDFNHWIRFWAQPEASKTTRIMITVLVILYGLGFSVLFVHDGNLFSFSLSHIASCICFLGTIDLVIRLNPLKNINAPQDLGLFLYPDCIVWRKAERFFFSHYSGRSDFVEIRIFLSEIISISDSVECVIITQKNGERLFLNSNLFCNDGEIQDFIQSILIAKSKNTNASDLH